jgi:2-polyprenyl-3-methyl-5-hydroxy-6-metoxy-1,4-benzoquinol methylase
LHFAPEPVLEYEIRKYTQHLYYTTDHQMPDVDFPKEDIQELSFGDSSFDLILSNHVLEHVPDDQQAVTELARILTPGGAAIITVPGDWRRRQTKTYSHLNYNGHYRDYGTDILDMFMRHFDSVKRKNLYNYNGRRHAIKKLEYAFVCEK